MRVIDLIKDHEGYRQHIYKDSRGFWTCGYGTLVEKPGPGMSRKVAEVALQEEVDRVVEELRRRLWYFEGLDPVRQAILIDMGYNLGAAAEGRGLFAFKRMLSAVEAGEWEAAANEMKNSAWFNQVGRRSQRLCRMMVTGRWPDETA